MHIPNAPIFYQASLGFLVTAALLWLLAKVAPRLGLVDKPSGRKQHSEPTPLVGGLAIYGALMTAAALWWLGVDWGLTPSLAQENASFVLGVFALASTILVTVGALDDRFNLGVFLRLTTEFAVALLIVDALQLDLNNLGNLFGTGDIKLPPQLSYTFTIVVIVGTLNALNMIDGLDGLLASLILCMFLGYRLISDHPPGLLGMTYAGALTAFLASNLNLMPRFPKTFLGDAGSKLLGLSVVSLLLTAVNNNTNQLISPVSILFVIGFPLYDMGYVLLKRIASNRSPFKPDRSHLHHLLKACGATDFQALYIILAIHLFMSFVGWVLHQSNAPEYYQFALYIGGFVLYAALVQKVWQALRYMTHLVNIRDSSA